MEKLAEQAFYLGFNDYLEKIAEKSGSDKAVDMHTAVSGSRRRTIMNPKGGMAKTLISDSPKAVKSVERTWKMHGPHVSTKQREADYAAEEKHMPRWARDRLRYGNLPLNIRDKEVAQKKKTEAAQRLKETMKNYKPKSVKRMSALDKLKGMMTGK